MNVESSSSFVTIVSGLPRSGTSMMMQMLERGGLPALTDRIRTADEDNPQGYYEFEPVKKTKKDASWLPGAVGKVVKMVHLLLLDLPDDYTYRVVFMRRELTEVIRSQNIMLQRSQKNGGDISEEKLIEIFQRQMDKVYQWMRDKPNFSMIEVSYNDVLRNPDPVITAINEFLGGELDPQAMRSVIQPSLYRNRKEATP